MRDADNTLYWDRDEQGDMSAAAGGMDDMLCRAERLIFRLLRSRLTAPLVSNHTETREAVSSKASLLPCFAHRKLPISVSGPR